MCTRITPLFSDFASHAVSIMHLLVINLDDLSERRWNTAAKILLVRYRNDKRQIASSGWLYHWLDSFVITAVQLQGEIWASSFAAAESGLLSSLHSDSLLTDPVWPCPRPKIWSAKDNGDSHGAWCDSYIFLVKTAILHNSIICPAHSLFEYLHRRLGNGFPCSDLIRMSYEAVFAM